MVHLQSWENLFASKKSLASSEPDTIVLKKCVNLFLFCFLIFLFIVWLKKHHSTCAKTVRWGASRKMVINVSRWNFFQKKKCVVYPFQCNETERNEANLWHLGFSLIFYCIQMKGTSHKMLMKGWSMFFPTRKRRAASLDECLLF